MITSEQELLEALNKGTAIINELVAELKISHQEIQRQTEEIRRLRNQLPTCILEA